MKKFIIRLFILCIVIFYIVLIHDLKTTHETENEHTESIDIKDRNVSLIPRSSIYIDFPTQKQYANDSNDIYKETIESESEVQIDYETEIKKELEKIESIKDKEKWFIKRKKLIEKYSDVYDPPETIYHFYSKEELDLLFRVVQAEIGDYNFEQRCNVVSVIFNRINHNEFPDTMFEVLTADQFATISNGRIYEVTVDDTTKLACE